jgi:glycosyltransferase involved in cell wall biosynthesis
MSKMKALIITYYWPPSGGPGVQRWLKFAKYLPGYDIQPVVLTVDPESAEYPIIDASLQADVDPELKVYRTKSKGVYDWYKKITGSKTAPYSGFANEGIPTFTQKTARFIRGNFFLPDARRGWIKYAYKEASRLIEKYNIETVITTGPPHSTHLTGLKLKKKYPVKWIADFRDPWSNIQYKSFLYQTRWAQNIDLKYERRVIEHCDYLMVAVDERNRLQKIHPGANAEKMIFMPNGYDESDFKGKQPMQPARLILTYTGTIAANYPAEGLLQALLQIPDSIPFTIRFVGKVDDHTRALFEKHLENKVEFIPFVSHDASIDYLMSSSILLLINTRAEGAEYILHGKTFEYMASGKPVLLLGSPAGIAARMISRAKAGATFEYDDIAGIKDFIIQQYRHPSRLPDMTYVKQFSRKILTGQLSDIIKS